MTVEVEKVLCWTALHTDRKSLVVIEHIGMEEDARFKESGKGRKFPQRCTGVYRTLGHTALAINDLGRAEHGYHNILTRTGAT